MKDLLGDLLGLALLGAILLAMMASSGPERAPEPARAVLCMNGALGTAFCDEITQP